MPDWQFLTGASDEEKRRFQAQTLSDIYRAMQTRLDGYRQSAGAVFLAVMATSLTFDSVFVRFVVDPGSGGTNPNLTLVVLVSGAIVLAVTWVSAVIIGWLGQYFAEMTSIVYMIDESNRVFERGAWLASEQLYPENFKISPPYKPMNIVTRRMGDVTLIGWHDPSIRAFVGITWVLFFLHLIVYGVLWMLIARPTWLPDLWRIIAGVV
jgi:hypothetical protein